MMMVPMVVMMLMMAFIFWKKRSIDVGATVFAVLVPLVAHGFTGRVVVQLGRETGRCKAGRFFVLSRVAKVAIDFVFFRFLLRRVPVDLFAIFGEGFPLVIVRVEDFVVVFQLGQELQSADVVLFVGNADLFRVDHEV